MATENRSRFNIVFKPGLYAMARDEAKRYKETWRDILAFAKTSKAYETSAYMSGLGYMPTKPEGEKYQTDARIQGPEKRWTPESFGLKGIITYEAIEDALYPVMKQITKDLVFSAKATRHLRAIRPIMQGTNTTYHTTGFGKALFATDHPKLGGGTFSNLFSAAIPSHASIESAVYNFENQTNERGLRVDQMAKGIFCGKEHAQRFDRLLNSTTHIDTEYNPGTKNIIGARGLELVVDAEITDGRWGIKGDKDMDNGLTFRDREAPRLSDHGDPDTGDNWYIVFSRFCVEANKTQNYALIPDFT